MDVFIIHRHVFFDSFNLITGQYDTLSPKFEGSVGFLKF